MTWLILVYYLIGGFFIFRIGRAILRRIQERRAEDFEKRDN